MTDGICARMAAPWWRFARWLQHGPERRMAGGGPITMPRKPRPAKSPARFGADVGAEGPGATAATGAEVSPWLT